MSGPRVYFTGVQIYRGEDDHTGVDWTDYNGKDLLPSPGGGSRDAAILIEIGVDGQYTTVFTQTGTIHERPVIAKAIEDLTYLLEHLDNLYPAGQRRGSCLTHGDWGRCRLADLHDGDHRFPTEQECRPAAVRRVS